MKISQILFILFCTVSLYSCSSDDDENTGNPDPQEPMLMTGVFVDSEVSGLSFGTDTQNGITNENGEFFYYEGETVTFSVGDIVLGSAEGAAQLTPVSIATTQDATIESMEVKNIAAFLQTLDSDADPSNGITIETAVVEALQVDEIDFTGNIVGLLGEMVAEINIALNTNLQVVYPEIAAVHMAESLGEEYESTDHVFSSFIPRFEGYFSTYGGVAQNSIYWVHNVNEEGLLINSSKYEKYPHRILAKYNYKQHNDLLLPTRVEQVVYRNGVELNNLVSYEFSYSEGNDLTKISTLDAESGNVMSAIIFSTTDENLMPTTLNFFDSEGNFTQRLKRVYDEDGNIIENYVFRTESGDEYESKWEYSYTDFGDFDQITRISEQQTSYENFVYRDDHTLEKRISTYSTSESVTTLEYDENEILSKAILDWGWTTVIRWFHDNGVRSKEEHYDADGNLTRIDEFDREGNLTSRQTF